MSYFYLAYINNEPQIPVVPVNDSEEYYGFRFRAFAPAYTL